MKDLGFLVPVGFAAQVGLEHNYRINMPEPYGACREKELQYYKHYTAATCDLDCLVVYVVKQCGCRDYYMPELYPGKPGKCWLELK